MSEQWKTCMLDANYEVSSIGRIRSKDRAVHHKSSGRTVEFTRTVKGKIIKPFYSKKTGYLQVNLGYKNRQSIHRLVALEFCDGHEDGLVVNHKNGIRDDNRAENLEWVTFGQNTKHSFRELGRIASSLGKFGHEHITSKPVIATCMKTGKEIYYECAHLARHQGFDSGSISRCCNGKNSYHKGFYWRFALPGTHRVYAENKREAAQ